MPPALQKTADTRVIPIGQRARIVVASFALLALLVLLSGCGQTLEITPTQAQAPAGTTLQLTAATLHELVATDVTSQVSWWSSNSAVATVTSAGVVSAVSPGSVTIWASLSGSTATMSLTVTAGTLVSIEVTPANPSLPNGLTEEFTATGVFSDNSTQDLTQLVTWTSSSPAVASVSNSAGTAGLASAASTGTTTVTATSASISGSTTLTVTSATLASIQVTPANPSTPKGVSQQFTATGIFSDNSTQNLTTQVTWASSNTGVATISNAAGAQGLASGASVGSITISATSGSISGSTTLTVTAATLVSIAVTPANPSIAKGLTKQFTATGTYTDNSTQNLSTQLTWASSNTSVTTISNAVGTQGLANSAAAGSTKISATSGTISGSTTLTVTAATLVSIAVTPTTPSIANGLTEQFTATGTYTDNSTQSLTAQVLWASSNSGVATISNAAGSQGLANSAAAGITTISASSGTISGSTTLTVTAATLVSIAVTPATSSIAKGLTEQFTATGTYTDGSTQNLSTQVTWTSSNTSAATISNASGSQGLASTGAVGSTMISATSGAVSGSTTLTVTSATLVSIAVTPANPLIANGRSEPFTATGTYTDSSTQNITTQVTWASSNTAVATISNASGSQGLASAASLGNTTISATSAAISGSTGLTVTACGFINCATITINHAKAGSSDSSNFPMLFSGTYSFLATHANGGSVENTVTQQGITVPADTVFTSDSGCTSPLNWEVESYDASTGAVNIWVQIPTLSHTVDTVIYLCVGNSSVSSFQGGTVGAAWDSNYQAVYHFPNGTTLSANDSTSNTNNGTISGATATSGLIDGAANIVNNAEITTSYTQSAVTAYTIEAWIISSYSGASIIVQDRGSGAGQSLTFALDGPGNCGGTSGCGAIGGASNSTGTPLFGEDSNGIFIGVDGATALNDGTWHHLVGTWSAPSGTPVAPSQFTLYVDGVAVSNPAMPTAGMDESPLTGLGGTVIGYHAAWGVGCNCSLDEVRISTAVRSADWITAEYNSQSSPATFYAVAN